MTPNPVPKLPVWKTIADVYIVTARHLGDLLRFAWPWLLVLFAISTALYWSFYPIEHSAAIDGAAGSSLLALLSFIASTTIGAFIAVPWHRTILLHEKQTLASIFAARSETLRYIWKALALMVATSLPAFLAVAISIPFALDLPALIGRHEAQPDVVPQSAIDLSAAMLILPGLAVLLWTFLMCRLSLILPATAIGRETIGIRDSWHTTSGNSWRLIFASIASTFVPYLILAYLVHEFFQNAAGLAIADMASTRISYTAFNVATELVAILLGMLFVTFLSITYRHFFGTVSDAASATRPQNEPNAAQ